MHVFHRKFNRRKICGRNQHKCDAWIWKIWMFSSAIHSKVKTLNSIHIVNLWRANIVLYFVFYCILVLNFHFACAHSTKKLNWNVMTGNRNFHHHGRQANRHAFTSVAERNVKADFCHIYLWCALYYYNLFFSNDTIERGG